ncbi:MAG: type II secretion system F family protein [Planctomycetota bacterium]
MATFIYKARRLDGSSVTGTLPAETERAALASLDRMGLFPLELKEEQAGGGPAKPVAASERQEPGGFDLGALFQTRVGAETVARFARQLADLSRAGVPILQALDAVSREPEEAAEVIWGAKEGKDDRRARLVLQDVRRDISQGATLADALARRPEFLPRTAISIVRAGEEGGFLPDALRRVAVFGEREMSLKRRIRGALAYPALLGVISASAVVFLLTWVVPRFSVIYEDMGGALPIPTQILIGAGDLLKNYWALWLVALAAGILGLSRLLATEEGRRNLDAFLLRTPLLRTVVANASIARFGRTLSTLLASGVGILRALDIAREAAGNLEFNERLKGVLGPIREGATLAAPLRETQLFPPQVLEMVEVGQETGNLVEVLERVGERADEEVDHALRVFITVLEPTLIVGVAAVVFFVVLAALLPVFSLNSLVQ